MTLFLFVSHCPSHPLSTSFENFHPSACPSFSPLYSLCIPNIIHSLGPSYDLNAVIPKALYLGSSAANCLVDGTEHTTVITFSTPVYKYFQCFPITLEMKSRFRTLFQNLRPVGLPLQAHKPDATDSSHAD